VSSKEIYSRFGRDLEYARCQCWCGCSILDVPIADVRAGVTGSCGRRLCSALGYSSVLTAGGEPTPCDCREREQAVE